VGWGLSPQFLSSLFQSGNGALILDLAGSKAQARQASAIYGQVNTLATRLGSSVATEVYGPQIVRRLDDLTKAVNRLPHGLGREINGAASKGRNKSR
ncbi:MAG: hypothetical protein HOQ45_11950, partial [Nocardioidaceae bacterium]|nr:hypothetical protein [Nocardioidaceae bacterium]